MPEHTLHKIMTATEPADVAQMAMIECLRQIADSGKRTASVLEGMQAELRDVRERVIKIEASEFKAELRETKSEIDRLRKDDFGKLEDRVNTLELDKAGRTGARGLADTLVKFGPVALALVGAVFIIMVATGRLVL